ncbi:hypothetical protein PLCT1_02006 [Planctomycetaceae bacterium]|nr:hypothetical protein PLCT1_02006 [Planctomycetaceae bacterium]
MRKLIFVIAALAALNSFAIAQDAPKATAPHLDTITVDDLKGDVYFLASDEMRGRETIAPESDIASAYIANRFRKAGLKPAGDEGGWYQNVQFAYTEMLEKPAIKVFEKGTDKAALELKYGEDFASFGGGGAGAMAQAQLVFAGYAITDKSKNWDDFADLDAKGKIALFLRYEPASWRSARGWSRNAFLETKMAQLKKAGVIGAIMVSGPGSTNGLDNWSNT